MSACINTMGLGQRERCAADAIDGWNKSEASELIVALTDALEGMMRHSCVADSAPEDKDGEDHAAESAALRALFMVRGR